MVRFHLHFDTTENFYDPFKMCDGCSEILASRKYLHAPFIIKPDFSPAERAIESALLKERRSLIQTGVNHN